MVPYHKNPGGNHTERFAMEGQQPDNVFEKKDEDTATKVQEELPQPIPDVTVGRYLRYDQSSVLVCEDCGVLVFDTQTHDNFHLRLVGVL